MLLDLIVHSLINYARYGIDLDSDFEEILFSCKGGNILKSGRKDQSDVKKSR